MGNSGHGHNKDTSYNMINNVNLQGSLGGDSRRENVDSGQAGEARDAAIVLPKVWLMP